MIKICFGCGVKLQDKDQSQEGYIPSTKIEKSSYCQRCYKLTHYGKVDVETAPKDNNNIINAINSDNKFTIFLTDFLNLNKEILSLYKQIKTPKILVISKSDIIPDSVSNSRLINHLKRYYQINDDVKFVSSNNNYGVQSLLNYLAKRKIETTYLVGISNSGKSTLINKIITSSNTKVKQLTTSKTLNTTRDYIRIKISDYLTIIDTPGFITSSLNYLEDKIIKPRTYQMKKDEIIKIDDLYFHFNNEVFITLYVPNHLKVSKYYKEVKFDNEIKVSKNNDVVINGLGFINVKQDTIIKTSNLKKDYLEVRKSIFGDFNE